MSTTITNSNPSSNINKIYHFTFKFHKHNNPNFNFNSCCLPTINHHHSSLCNQESRSCPFNISCMLTIRKKLTILAKGTSNDSQESRAPKPPSSGWKKWIVGLMLSIILPSFRHKWGPLLTLKTKVDSAMEMVESVTEVVEEIAEEAQKLAEELEKKLPEDTKLRDAAEMIEKLAKEAVKEADLAQELIHKVHDVEEEVEALIESGTIQAKTVNKETIPNNKDVPAKM